MINTSSHFDLLQLYADHMQQIKERLQKIESVVAEFPELGQRKIPKNVHFEFEFVCLQLRKVLESIVHCSMIAVGNEYQKVHRDFLNHSRAKNIVKNLNKLHRRWFPEFVYVNRHGAGSPTIVPGGSAFNQKRWGDLYDFTSEVIHVQNGFTLVQELKLEFNIPDYLAKIQWHLSNHVVTQLGGGVFLCELGDVSQKIVVSDCRLFGVGDILM